MRMNGRAGARDMGVMMGARVRGLRTPAEALPLRQVGVGVVVVGLPARALAQAAVIHQQLERLGHVLGANAKRAIVRVVGALVERRRGLHADQRGVLDARLGYAFSIASTAASGFLLASSSD